MAELVGRLVAAPAAGPVEPAAFAHNAEREFAALLDFYGVAWDYEPRTFVLETGPDGCPTLAFTPDFYLPEFDRYIEVTTLDQKLVTRKNRKARLLRELEPGIDLQIVYRRDYLQLLVKYGLAPPEQAPVGPPMAAPAAEAAGLIGATVILAADGVGAEAGGRRSRPTSAA